MWLKRRLNYTWLSLVTFIFLITYLCMKTPCIINNCTELEQEVVVSKRDETPSEIVGDFKREPNKKVWYQREERLVFHIHVENGSLPNKEQKRDNGTPVTNIAFLKVHKAGSSTIQNILFRFGIKKGLTFVLPVKWHYVIPGRELIPLKPGGHYDMFACHTIYRKGRFDMLPRGYKTFAIVREPLKRMISAAYFYRDKMHKKYLMNVTRERLVPDLINHYRVFDKDLFSRTRNSMGDDFGFKEVAKQGYSAIQKHLKHLESKFELVLVMERFDESLVLMKRKFNWSFRDIIYMKSNSYSHPTVDLTEKEIEKFKNISFLDYKIYDMFKKKFDTEVNRLGDEFQNEVKQFKRIVGDVNTFCSNPSANEGLEIKGSEWNDLFEVKYDDCAIMKMNDLRFVEKMKTRHRRMNNLPEPTEAISKIGKT